MDLAQCAHRLQPPRRVAVCIVAVGVSILCTQIRGESINSRERLPFDRDWRFRLGDPADAAGTLDFKEVANLQKLTIDQHEEELALDRLGRDREVVGLGRGVRWVEPSFDDTDWRRVNLPHDWMHELNYDPQGSRDQGYRAFGGKFSNTVGWYRKHFSLPASYSGQALWVEFDGIFRNSLVWLNGHCLGRNVSGYSGVAYDLREYANVGAENTIVVRVDASRAEGWFYEGAGIYRHVWLTRVPPVHVAHWGTYIRSLLLDERASVKIDTVLVNDESATAVVRLGTRILDPKGGNCSECDSETLSISPGQSVTVHQEVMIDHPELWSTETPSLYKAVSCVNRDSGCSDKFETYFGIRSIQFTGDEGFKLNGRKVVIKGVSIHQDHAGVGTAVPDRLNRWRLERLREMGCNAIRTAHNPPSPEVLDACDRLGILVLDENRRFSDSREGLSQVERMIRRDRNHPSVVMWSLGNEEMEMQANDAVSTPILGRLQDLAHRLDPSRPCTLAMNGSWGKGLSKIIDVQGFNYLRNGGGPDAFHAAFPQKPTVGTEEACTVATRGEYVDDSYRGYFSSYDAPVQVWSSSAESWCRFYHKRPWLAGAFAWTGFDYRGEPSPSYWPAVNAQDGIMDLCGFPKDVFYYYKAWWSNESVLHLFPHWDWEGVDRRRLIVSVRSQADRVELTLNDSGKTYRPLQNGVANFELKYRAGKLRIQTITGMKQVDGPTHPRVESDISFPVSEQKFVAHLSSEPGELVTTQVEKPDAVRVWAETNCSEVELFLNGRSQGRRKVDEFSHAEWMVPFQAGTLEARGFKQGRLIVTDRIETTGPAVALRLSSDRERFIADGRDVSIVTVAVVDARGRLVSNAENRINFHVDGGVLLGLGNGDPSSHESDLGPDRSAFHGLAQLIVGAPLRSGPIVVTCSSSGLRPDSLLLHAEQSSDVSN